MYTLVSPQVILSYVLQRGSFHIGQILINIHHMAPRRLQFSCQYPLGPTPTLTLALYPFTHSWFDTKRVQLCRGSGGSLSQQQVEAACWESRSLLIYVDPQLVNIPDSIGTRWSTQIHNCRLFMKVAFYLSVYEKHAHVYGCREQICVVCAPEIVVKMALTFGAVPMSTGRALLSSVN